MEYKFKKNKTKKKMAFKLIDPVRSKTLINDNIIEQINTFVHPGCCIS